MKYSIVLKSVVTENFDFRIDADYYNPEYLRLAKQIHKKQYVFLEEKSCVKGGKRLPLGENFSNEGVPYIRAEDVKNSFVEYENSPKISLFLHNKLKNYKTTYNDVLITIVGNSIGDIGIVKFKISKCNLTENCAKIINLREILPEYLFIFLGSKFGQYQIKRETVGTAQPKLALVRIKQFQIPILLEQFQNKIRDIVETSYIYTCILNEKYKLSEKILIKELNIENWSPNHKLWSVKNYSDVKDTNRLDAEYFQPRYDEIMNILNKNGYTRLIDNFNIVRNSGLEYHEDGKIGVIKTKQIKDKFIDFNVESKTNLYEDNVIVKNKDVLFASMGVGSLGKANIYYNFENNNEFIIDSTLKIFRKKINGSISPELLEAYLHTQIAQELIYQNVVGSSGIISVYESYLQELPIPIINNSVEQKIVENIKTAHLLNYQSKQLLEIAKRGVEIAIEQDEDIATSWIDQELQKIGVEL